MRKLSLVLAVLLLALLSGCNDAAEKEKAEARAIETGRVRLLVQNSRADLLWAGATTHPRTGEPAAVVTYYARMERHFLDASLRGDFETLEAAHAGDVSFVGASMDDRVWLIRYMNGGPLDYYAWRRDTKSLTPLFTDMPDLGARDLPFCGRADTAWPGRRRQG